MPLEFRTGPAGRVLPLQKVRSVYVERRTLLGTELVRSDVTDSSEATFVSHFETCPAAGQFTRGKP